MILSIKVRTSDEGWKDLGNMYITPGDTVTLKDDKGAFVEIYALPIPIKTKRLPAPLFWLKQLFSHD